MGKTIRVKIAESTEFLVELLEKEKDAKRYQKLRTLSLLKTEKVKSCSEIANILERNRATIRKWIEKYRQNGLLKLLEDGSERFNNIPLCVIDSLVEQFQDARFTVPIRDIQCWLRQELGVQITYQRLQRLIQFKLLPVQRARRTNRCQEPEKVAIEIADLKDLSSVYTYFSEWKDQRGFPNDSQALNQLLGEFFGLRSVHTVSSLQQPGKTLIGSLCHISLTNTIPYHIPDLMLGNLLAKRLKVSASTLYQNHNKRTFPGWTKHRDPDGVGWVWEPELRKYRALLSNDEIKAFLSLPNK